MKYPKSRLDPNQIAQHLFDEESQANRVTITDTEMAMELSADDGDTVAVEARHWGIKVAPGEVWPCHQVSRIMVYAKGGGSAGDVRLSVSPETDGHLWADAGKLIEIRDGSVAFTASKGVPVMALRAKIEGPEDCELWVVAKGL